MTSLYCARGGIGGRLAEFENRRHCYQASAATCSDDSARMEQPEGARIVYIVDVDDRHNVSLAGYAVPGPDRRAAGAPRSEPLARNIVTSIAMADSWEDEGEDIVLQAAKPRLRADAPAFTFNPGASSFQPPAFNAQPMQPAAFAAPQPPANHQQGQAPVPSFQQAAFAPQAAGPPSGFAASAPEVARAPREAEGPPAAEDHPMEDAQYPLDRAGVEPESERDPPGEQRHRRSFCVLRICLMPKTPACMSRHHGDPSQDVHPGRE